MLAEPSRFEKKKVQFTFHYNEATERAHGFSFRHVLTKALVKQVGYGKVPPSHYQFFKGPIRKFSQRLPSAFTNLWLCNLGQITKVKNDIREGKKKKEKGGRKKRGKKKKTKRTVSKEKLEIRKSVYFKINF